MRIILSSSGDRLSPEAVGAYLRRGILPLPRPAAVEAKFNPYHDPANGRFSFGPGGAGPPSAYRGMTRNGVSEIRPVGGGGTDRNGQAIPEQFPPDPYALHSPAEAMAHYAGGSGEDRNSISPMSIRLT